GRTPSSAITQLPEIQATVKRIKQQLEAIKQPESSKQLIERWDRKRGRDGLPCIPEGERSQLDAAALLRYESNLPLAGIQGSARARVSYASSNDGCVDSRDRHIQAAISRSIGENFTQAELRQMRSGPQEPEWML